MKKYNYLFIILIFLGCSNLSPNKYQIKSTEKNIDCFKELVAELRLNENLVKKIIEIRKSKIRGNFDPITVKQGYRLINSEEIESILPISWKNNCLRKLTEHRDFRGLRFINKDSIIIEIDKFDRHTLSERYSKNGTIEIHRIIISRGKIQNQSFKFGSEKTKFVENFENGWVYEITQIPGY